MNLIQLKKEFLTHLKGEYPTQEISSFLHLLMQSYMGLSRLDVALKPELELSAAQEKQFKTALFKLKDHQPVQYIIGETSFFGLKFKVGPAVLIPRPETGELVNWIIEDCASSNLNQLKILDIGTGSGCIAISLAKNLPGANVTAIDISEEALEIAKENAIANKVTIEFIKKDILNTTELSSFYDIIVSNPPYVRELEKQEMQPNVLNNEPEIALFVKDEDPLLFYEKITSLAKKGLKTDGVLYFEINQYLDQETSGVLEKFGFSSTLRKDIFGNFRMVKGMRKK